MKSSKVSFLDFTPRLAIICVVIFSQVALFGQTESQKIAWKLVESTELPSVKQNASFPLNPNFEYSTPRLIVTTSEPVQGDLPQIANEYSFNEEPHFTYNFMRGRNESWLSVEVWPYFIKNGEFHIVRGMTIELNKEKGLVFAKSAQSTDQSVLANGLIYKLSIAKSGVYKITYAQLKNNGLVSSAVSSNSVHLFGNGTGMLPFLNEIERPDDIKEVAYKMIDGGDGQFGEGDYLLFYGHGPTRVGFDEARDMYLQTQHLYDTKSYYFIKVDNSSDRPELNRDTYLEGASLEVENQYTYVDYHEQDLLNLAESGRRALGEIFDFTLSREVVLSVPNHHLGSAKVRVDLSSKGINSSSSMAVFVDGIPVGDLGFTSTSGYGVASRRALTYNTQVSGDEAIVKLTYTKGDPSAKGYLDFVTINVPAAATVEENQHLFYINTREWLTDSVSFFINGLNNEWTVLDVTTPHDIFAPTILNGENVVLPKDGRDDIKLAVFRGSSFPAPEWIGKVENQNLHSDKDIEYVIVVPNYLRSEAERLAAFHQGNGMSVKLVDPNLIYNEFSSGARDATAIRDYMRMLYHRALDEGGVAPKYLLLFGDGSYWNKNRADNTNVLPTFQSQNSESLIDTYVTDDYFGFMDDDEGEGVGDLVDIGVGRFPVTTIEQAKNVVDKVLRYSKPIENEGFGSWRNIVAFTADDADGNGAGTETFHMTQANDLSEILESKSSGYLVKKIYLDAYQQEASPGGERYPVANKALRDRVEEGALIVNYTGHGGELGWAHERFLDVSTINSWGNSKKLPLFVTATCEFSRFDDPDRTSAGEYCLLNPKGGAIALFTTTRLVFAYSNFALSKHFYKYAVPTEEYADLKMGDIMRLTKNDMVRESSNSPNHLNFSLLGDPAMRLAYPENKVVTTKVNGKPIATTTDTIKALSKVKVEGEIQNVGNQKLSNFNGLVEVVVMDKQNEVTTLSNDENTPYTYKVWQYVIYKGLVEVTNGEFSFEFVVPKDINFQVGNGLFNYYAWSETEDANGGTSDFFVGGAEENIALDEKGPDIELYLNDLDFVSGNQVGEKPSLLAYLFDSSGVNTTGNGIGHDLSAVLDANTENAIVLNNYYTADLNSYQKGRVWYDLDEVDEGAHTLTLKAWDNYNNPSTSTIHFVVVKNNEGWIENLLNYPNPVSTQTTFRFDHNMAGEEMDVQVKIFDIKGNAVATINAQFTDDGYRTKDVTWDGKTNNGGNISSGTYVYSVNVKTLSGKNVSKTSSLVVVK